ncbi:HAMP domain-containing histidine kinase [Oscillospiraceae bacterium N12]|jgi:signal transduction histidine kinase|uniref:histidine kinase n=1 Tax=Jilunia laotingensis TaxID=2763675 RepID=A0A926IQ70_9BACT|nr:HAMP domain-containing sensor histidine kinase [Jilunia laotingensis]MBC8593506.1 HAMP domain-containing histidine kinase [Jilunia laotingensis]
MSNLRYILYFVFFCLSTITTQAQASQEDNPEGRLTSPMPIREDSLNIALDKAKDPHKRIELLLDLKDVTEGMNNEAGYVRQLFNESKEGRDVYGLFVSIMNIVIRHATHEEKEDSLYNYYIKTIADIEKGTPAEGAATFFKMTIINRKINTENDANTQKELFKQIRNEFQALQPHEDKYQKVNRLYNEGLMRVWEMNGQGKKGVYKEQIPLWQEAWDIAQEFPLYTKRYYLSSIFSLLSSGYNQEQDYKRLQQVTTDAINAHKDFYTVSAVMYPRPFLYKDNTYVDFYTQLIRGAMHVSDDEAYKMYNLFRDHMLSAKDEFLDKNKIYLYETAYLFLTNMHHEKEAISNCDSLINMIETGRAPGFSRILRVYKDKAKLLTNVKRPEDACIAYERAIQVSDSLIKKEYVERVEALRLKNDVNRLELEKTSITAQSRLIGFIFAICTLIVAISVSVYYYKSLKKTRKLQEEIYRQSIKAQESEQMKSSFINSICHEIRTPLNSINGFSEVLIDDATLPEERKEYQMIIQENTHLLTSLLDSLIEVANLDSLTEALTLEEVEVTALCRTEMELLHKKEGKDKIQYLLDLPREGCFAHTHPQYLSLLLRSLLNNANKFTREGSILLSCRCNKEQKKVIISVADTGCGIPADKQEYIFQRFTKLDTFTHGNGLGLYLCRLIARHMNGNIQIDPHTTQGAKFIFTIPMGKDDR